MITHLMNVKREMTREPMMDDWYMTMPLQASLTELWLVKGNLARARQAAGRFLDVVLTTAERTYQGLAWEANARVAMAAQDWQRAEECIVNGLSTLEGKKFRWLPGGFMGQQPRFMLARRVTS